MFPRFYKILLVSLFACSVIFAQAGRISGKVTDQETGEPLVGANVVLLGTSLGAATDINGEFLVNKIGRAHV